MPEITPPETSPASPPSDRETIDDLRARLSQAEKKLKGARLEMRGLRERDREGMTTVAVERVVYAEAPDQDAWTSALCHALVLSGILQRTRCRVCGINGFWTIRVKDRKFKMLGPDLSIHYHPAADLHKALNSNRDQDTVPQSVQAPLSKRHKGLLRRTSDKIWNDTDL